MLDRRTIVLSIAIALVAAGGPLALAGAQPSLDPIRALWRSGNYLGAIPLLVDYRTGPYGRTAEVDYMLGTCACRVEGMQDLGRSRLGRVLYDYALPPEHVKLVTQEIDRCGAIVRPVVLPVSAALAQASVEGKTFFWVGQKNALASVPPTIIRTIPYDEIAARLFPPSQGGAAARHVGGLAGPDFKVLHEGPFVLASRTGHSPADLAAIGQTLQRFLRFFTSRYEIPAPRHLVTVYLVGAPWELRRLAEDIHGIRISTSTIAYSYRDDRSLAGVIPTTQIGSLAHELFHLLVRERFGDVPMWMDEGLAALYEVSMLTPGGIVGVDNWRRRVLQEVWTHRPSVGALVRMTSGAFANEPKDFELERQAANHAMARYLMLYLQERGTLAPLYRAFRDRDVDRLAGDPGDEAVRLVEAVVGQPVADLDRDFERWFRAGPLPAPEGTLVDKTPPPQPE